MLLCCAGFSFKNTPRRAEIGKARARYERASNLPMLIAVVWFSQPGRLFLNLPQPAQVACLGYRPKIRFSCVERGATMAERP